MDQQEQDRQKHLITEGAAQWGFSVVAWEEDPYQEGKPVASLGDVSVLEGPHDDMFSEGEEGTLYASVVGSQAHRNEHVGFSFKGEGMDEAMGISPDAVEAV